MDEETKEPEVEEEATDETDETDTPETAEEVTPPPEDKVRPVEPVPPAATAAAPKNDLKIIMIGGSGSWMLGVQSTDCDPFYTTMEGDLAVALQRIPSLVEEAKQKWATAKRYPKANLPEPEPVAAPARTTTTRTPAAPAKPKAQPSFF